MTYMDRCINAIHRTQELGLTIRKNPLPFSKAISSVQRNDILVQCAKALKACGYHSSDELAKKCIPVHLMLNQHLKHSLKVESFITIGDRYWSDGDIYCEMSYADIKRELDSPNPDSQIDAHVWLTLSDGSILDCTSEAHLDIIQGRGIYKSDQCLLYIEADEKDDPKGGGYYRPYLFGTEFLVKTSAAPAFLVQHDIAG